MIVLTVMSLDKMSVLGLVIVRVIMIVLTVMSLDKVSVYNPNNNQDQY
jgi:hypothetical protein